MCACIICSCENIMFEKKFFVKFSCIINWLLYSAIYNIQWFSPSTPVYSTNKIDRHDIVEILLKVVLNTINQTYIQHPKIPLHCAIT